MTEPAQEAGARSRRAAAGGTRTAIVVSNDPDLTRKISDLIAAVHADSIILTIPEYEEAIPILGETTAGLVVIDTAMIDWEAGMDAIRPFTRSPNWSPFLFIVREGVNGEKENLLAQATKMGRRSIVHVDDDEVAISARIGDAFAWGASMRAILEDAPVPSLLAADRGSSVTTDVLSPTIGQDLDSSRFGPGTVAAASVLKEKVAERRRGMRNTLVARGWRVPWRHASGE
ncbi:hypothetical protein ACIB24_14845 [Spongisporangium articulatum]|uniref:Response regulatory domain-containing protein n=1 Tax=Spongisporangium articulatum TaxID=3362603 RepID=A0ABW8APN5_9ACTN